MQIDYQNLKHQLLKQYAWSSIYQDKNGLLYLPTESIDRKLFFDEVFLALSKAVNKYDYIILAGDLNVDMDIPNSDTRGYLSDLCDTFDLTNLINKKTCTKKVTAHH